MNATTSLLRYGATATAGRLFPLADKRKPAKTESVTFSVQATMEGDELRLPSVRSQPLLLLRLSSKNYQLVSPLFLEMESGFDSVSLWEARSGAYGVGKTLEEAVKDFQSMLEEMHEQLSESESTLSHALYEQLKYLRSIISPV